MELVQGPPMTLGGPGPSSAAPVEQTKSEEKENDGSNANTITSSEQVAKVQNNVDME